MEAFSGNLPLSQCVLFVDLQDGLVEAARTQSVAELRRGAGALACIAGILGMPVVVSTIATGPNGAPPVISDISDVLDVSTATHVRRCFGALGHRDTKARLERSGKRTILISGVLTEGAVLSSALEARDEGWSVQVVLDACAGRSRRTEEAAIRQMDAVGVCTTSLVSIVSLLDLDLSCPPGSAVMTALRGMSA